MTPDELKALISAAANPDTAPEALASLSDKVTEMITAADEAKKASEDANRTIASLRDTNMRLFLRTTTTDTHQDEELKELEEMTHAELREYFANKMKGDESNGSD